MAILMNEVGEDEKVEFVVEEVEVTDSEEEDEEEDEEEEEDEDDEIEEVGNFFFHIRSGRPFSLFLFPGGGGRKRRGYGK